MSSIHTQRLVHSFQNDLKNVLANFVYEPNDAFTRRQIQNIVGNYLANSKANRSIYDYKVVCDESNNLPQDIDNHQLRIDLYVKPAHSINYITINAVVTADGTGTGHRTEPEFEDIADYMWNKRDHAPQSAG